ncbi:hypothetical protein H4Q26_007079 [Puccinia striiformis f. sp. tritici PST-130]|nr:hypothetical protein H4Q26_007079 [Puccinia striiformis f. sp. tritici PST-130]
MLSRFWLKSKCIIFKATPWALLAVRRKKISSASHLTQDNLGYENMKTCYSFLTPAHLQVFEEATEDTPEQPADVIDIYGVEDNAGDESDWDLQELWVS